MAFTQQKGGASCPGALPESQQGESPMTCTMLQRTRLIPTASGLAIALACTGPGTPRLATPAPAPDEEVSVGYGTQLKKNTTAAVSSITPTEADARVARVEDLLAARVPGLEVLPRRDGTYSLRIRGQHGLRGTSADDEPFFHRSVRSAPPRLAAGRIASIGRLKDGGGTRVFGSRGANRGVILPQ